MQGMKSFVKKSFRGRTSERGASAIKAKMNCSNMCRKQLIDPIRSGVRLDISFQNYRKDHGDRSRIDGVIVFFLGRTKSLMLIDQPTDPIDHPSKTVQ